MRKKNKEKKIQELCEIPLLSSEKMSLTASDDDLTNTSDDDCPALSFDDCPDNDSGNCCDSCSKTTAALPPVSYSVYGVQIDGHYFEEAKNNLKSILDRTKANPELAQVKTFGGLFNLFSHNVTGDELNELTAQIQKHLIGLNNFDSDIITQMEELYQTIDALDKDYIQKIVISLQCAEKASQDAQKALTETNKTVSEYAATQKDLQTAQSTLCDTNERIDKTVSQLEKTIVVLSKFKSKVDNVCHLSDVDKMWEDYHTLKETTLELVGKIQNIVDELEGLARITDIDDIREKYAETEGKLIHTELTVSEQQNEIDSLKVALSKTQRENAQKISLTRKLAFTLSGVSLCTALTALIFLFLR